MKPVLHKGFTLLELMIVVAVVAILGTIAMSNYGDYIDRSRCTEGRTALLSGAASLEKCKAIYGVYDEANCNTAAFLGNTPEGYFTVTMTRDATSFTLTATGLGAAAAASNSFCPTITLNHLGVQGGTGSSPW